MADEANLSKRERQKQRREVKLAEQRAAAARARRSRLVLFGVCALIVVGLVGAAIANQQAQRREQAAAAEAVTARLGDLGCTPDTEQPDLGGGHLDDPQILAQSPPEVIYDDRPTSSGQHVGSVAATGVYDVRIDERLLVHNLEHGYVVAYYGSDAPDDQVAELKEFAQTQIDGAYPKLIVAPWDGALPEEANFAWTAWRFRQSCEQFDPEVLSVFLSKHHSGAGIAPEKTIDPHLGEGNGGGIEPQGEPVLLPPLAGATEGATEGAPTEQPATEGAGATEPTATEDPTGG